MSEIKKDKCDFCGKETNDHYNEEGWIRLEGLLSISISRGRRDDGQAIRDYDSLPGEGNNLDFCDVNCLLGFLKQVGSKEERNSTENCGTFI